MALRNIINDSDPILRKPSREVKEITDHIRMLALDLWDTLYDADGVGLAAPQVGVLRRVAVIDATRPEPEEDSEEVGEDEPVFDDVEVPPVKYLLINPEIIERSEEAIVSQEGCLSVPGMVGMVERAVRVKVRALDIDGVPFEVEGEGLLAKALQHEVDHLNGVLYVDIAESVEPLMPPEPEEVE